MSRRHTGCALGLLLLVPSVRAEVPAFDRYQAIIDRAPFGAMTGGGAGVPQPGFAEAFGFVGTVPDVNSDRLLAMIYDKGRNGTILAAQGDLIGAAKDVRVVRLEVKPAPKLVLQRGLEVATLAFEEVKGGPVVPVPGGGAVTMPASANVAAPVAATGDSSTVRTPGPRRIPFRRGD